MARFDTTSVPIEGAGVVYAQVEMRYSSRFPSYELRERRRPRRRGDSWRGPRPKGTRRFSLALPPDVVLFVAVGLCVGGLLFLYIRQGTFLQHLTAERETAQENLTQLEEINHSLEIQVEQGFSYERLSQYATEKLGMVAPSKVQYVHVPKAELR